MSAKNPNGLTDQQHRFCLAYLADPEKNATGAYRKAYPKAKQTSCETGGARLLQNEKVKEFLAEQRAKDEERTGVDREYVLSKLMEMAEVGLQKREIKDKDGNVTHHRFVDTYAGSKGVELLGKHFKMFTDKVEHSGEIRHTGVLRIGASEMSMEDWLKATGGTVKEEESKK